MKLWNFMNLTNAEHQCDEMAWPFSFQILHSMYNSGAFLHERHRLFFAWTPPKRSALLEQPSLAEVDLAGVMMGSTLAWALCPHCKVCWLYLHHREFLCLHGHIKQVSCHISSQKIVKKATFWRTKKEKDELLIVSPILNGDEEGSTLQRKRRKEGKRQGADLLGDGGVLPAGALP